MADLKEAPSVEALIAALRQEEESAIARVRWATEEKIKDLRLAHEAFRDLPKDIPSLVSEAAAVFVTDTQMTLGYIQLNSEQVGQIKSWPGEPPPPNSYYCGPRHNVRVIVAVIDKGWIE